MKGWFTNWRFPLSSLQPDLYRRMIELLVAARKEAGLTQAELGKRLGQRQTFVSKFELGERRLDAAEFIVISRAIGVDPYVVMRGLRQHRAARPSLMCEEKLSIQMALVYGKSSSRKNFCALMRVKYMKNSLRSLGSFGAVAAEDDDTLLNYFLSTESVSSVEKGDVFLVLGRKGSGKTAIVRHFTEGEHQSRSRALNLRNYPWNVHANRIDRGADNVDAYVASWRYLIAIEIASWALERSANVFNDNQKPLREFLTDNYGGVRPQLSDIIRPSRLRIRGFNVAPHVLGNALGAIELERGAADKNLGLELEALTSAIIACSTGIIKECRLGEFYIHFDELDAGLNELDETRKNMLIGLILAVRSTTREFRVANIPIKPVLYLRTDIWDDLNFSDKNKITQGQAQFIEWNSESLLSLINERLQSRLGAGILWENVIDDQLMRESQPKWNHIVARTLKRPRDIIQFLNISLKNAVKRKEQEILITNKDIVGSRGDYSSYFKRELDDEILPHWKAWEQAIQAMTSIGTEIFVAADFNEEYAKRKTNENTFNSSDALRILHRFSVIGYPARSGYGGSRWVFMYEEPDRGWDVHATRFKVHPGLKEYAGLREERK